MDEVCGAQIWSSASARAKKDRKARPFMDGYVSLSVKQSYEPMWAAADCS